MRSDFSSNSCAVVCASWPLFRPPRSYPRSHIRYCSRFRPGSRPRSHPVFVYGSPPPSPSPFPPRSCSHSRFVPVPTPDPVTVSVPTPDSDPAPDPVRSLPSLGPGYPLGTMRLYRHPGLANGAVECSQAPPHDACGMKVPAVKQKRIAAEDMLLPSLPQDVGTRWSVSPTFFALPVRWRVPS